MTIKREAAFHEAGHAVAAHRSKFHAIDLAADLAVVLAAGLVSERLAAAWEPGLTPMPDRAVPDHELLRQQLAGAGLPQELKSYEETAAQAF